MALKKRQIVCLAILMFAASVPAARGEAPTGYSFAVVAALEDAAPGGGQHVGDFEPEDINSRGDVTFASDLVENDIFLGEGLYGRYHEVERLIARSGDPIPGTNLKYGPFGILTPSGMNDSGDVAFGFTIDVPFAEFGTNAAVFRYDSRSAMVSPVFLPGDPAPGGTTFRGAQFHADLNNRGQIAATALVESFDGHCTDPNAACYGLGRGVYAFDRFNNATKIAAPGDPAPGGTSTFDDAWDPNLNNRGDVIFGGHVKGETCSFDASFIGCFESLYLYRASTGRLSSIAHQGDPAPGGGTFAIAFNGYLNDGGDASFIGTLAEGSGVFLRDRKGQLLVVARTGTPLPGGVMKNATFNQGSHAVDNAGHVAFVAALDADSNVDGLEDTGVYLWAGGVIKTVVRTGTVIPGLGTVAHVNNPYFVGTTPYPNPGVHLSERGQVLTQVIMEGGATYVVVATPR